MTSSVLSRYKKRKAQSQRNCALLQRYELLVPEVGLLLAEVELGDDRAVTLDVFTL